MSKVNLLIIEDETDIRNMIRFAFPSDAFSLIDAESAAKAMQLLTHHIPDLILLDWMLPGESGISFIRWLKQQPRLRQIPIIMLTAKAEEDNKIKGLATGADDYVTKPFSPKELIARIRTVLRRGVVTMPNNQLECCGLQLNLDQQNATVDSSPLSLTPIEYKMLHFFMKNPGRTFSRDQLITHIWGVSIYIDDRTVDVQVRRLRDKLKAFNHHTLIKTVRGLGYQFDSCDEKAK